MKLLIDAGNTRIKWALADANDWVRSGILPVEQAGELSQLFASVHDIQQIWVSNVAGVEIAQHIRNIGAGKSRRPHFVVAREAQCGVRNGYSNASQLGSDRWAALIAAWHLVKGKCLVVNSGTATTIDTLSEQGEFLGGLILPGVELMQRSLVAATVQLKSVQGEYVPLPLNSADALYSGAIQASCGAIERQYALLSDDSAPVVLSGGAAGLLQPHLNQDLFSVPLRVVDNLVLQGLLLLAQEANVS
jgi:type III pantothenate kinase